MNNHTNNLASGLSDEEFEFLKLQYENSINGYLAFFNQMVTVFTIVLIAFITLMGFAFENKNAGLIFLGTVLLIASYGYASWNRKQQFTMLFTSTIIENMINPQGFDGYMITYIGHNYGKDLVDKFIDVGSERNFEERLITLKSLPSLLKPTLFYRIGVVVLTIFALILLLSPFLLHKYLGWDFL